MTENTQASAPFQVAVVGAGPAGLYAARELAAAGARVTLFNRDIKPGGLAEYGIYPHKYKMKDGLRAQFRQILAVDGLRYLGNVSLGQPESGADLSLDDLRALGFDAILVTVGAQGTKWLGLPGENLQGVYHAKDLVYHYNSLPPYSERRFPTGQRVAVVGVGNVALDITHWLLEERAAQEVVAVARRGPAEVKFEKKELEYIARYLDQAALERELERVAPQMSGMDQNPDGLRAMVQSALERAPEPKNSGRFRLEFLSSPLRILGDGQGRVRGLEVEENALVRKDEGVTTAIGTGRHHTLAVDTVIFAIGDKVDEGFGLPVRGIEFVKNPAPRFPQDGLSFEPFDPQTGQVIPDVFIAGWARQASHGLVGVARRDGSQGSKALLAYLQTLPGPRDPLGAGVAAGLEALSRRVPLIGRAELERLEVIERKRAQALGLPEFKFDSNEKMLKALGIFKIFEV